MIVCVIPACMAAARQLVLRVRALRSPVSERTREAMDSTMFEHLRAECAERFHFQADCAKIETTIEISVVHTFVRFSCGGVGGDGDFQVARGAGVNYCRVPGQRATVLIRGHRNAIETS